MRGTQLHRQTVMSVDILRHLLRPASVSYYRYPVLLDLAVIRSLRCLVARQPVQPYTPILTASRDAACSRALMLVLLFVLQ